MLLWFERLKIQKGTHLIEQPRRDSGNFGHRIDGLKWPVLLPVGNNRRSGFLADARQAGKLVLAGRVDRDLKLVGSRASLVDVDWLQTSGRYEIPATTDDDSDPQDRKSNLIGPVEEQFRPGRMWLRSLFCRDFWRWIGHEPILLDFEPLGVPELAFFPTMVDKTPK